MQRSGKLELTWVGKYEQTKVEPRILIEKPKLSYGYTDSGNMLIHGDNLIALRALEQDFTGKVKCIYIDPPYNTGSAFEHYDDGLEHSEWLCMMKPRLEILRNLLSDDGSIWITLDDNEVHYCKVMSDEIFGRKNFVADVIWEKSDSPRMDAKIFSSRNDHILVYAKNVDCLAINRLINDEIPEHYNKTDDCGRRYYLKPLRAMGKNDAREARPNLYYGITTPDGNLVFPIRTDGSDGNWRWSRGKVTENPDMIEWISGRKGWTPYYRIFADASSGMPPETLWRHEDAGSNRTSKMEMKQVFGGDKSFDTPKPESLVKRVFLIATNAGDLVLDSFLGSGTTAAVAHKMDRRWIGIELGEHAYTHCKVRLDKVVDGEQGGISKAVGWQGGGGYKFYELAPSLLEKHPVLPVYQINKTYTFEMVCEAICKLEGFIYKPEGKMHGHSSESRFIHITREFLSGDYITKIMKEVSDNQSILIYGIKIQSGLRLPDNVEVKKIPKDLLKKCSFESEVR